MTSCLLIQPGPDARTYEIRRADGDHPGERVALFATEGVGGKSADETAIGNVIAVSEGDDGTFLLYYLPSGTLTLRPSAGIALASAVDGIGRYEVDPDDASADSTYGYPEWEELRANLIRIALRNAI